MSFRISIFLAALVLTSCAEDRYRWNTNHAYVTPWTHLSSNDKAAIVRVISFKDEMPIIGISEHRADKRGSTISVYTGNTGAIYYSRWHGYDLRKEQDDTWHIVFDGECSQTIAGLDLSGQIRELQQRRSR